MKTKIHFPPHLAQFFLEWKIFQIKVVEKIKTHILCSITFFPRKPSRFIMRKNVIEEGRPQMTKRRMRIACWIPKATNTRTGCVILNAFPLQQWLNERASILHLKYTACLVKFTVPKNVFTTVQCSRVSGMCGITGLYSTPNSAMKA